MHGGTGCSMGDVFGLVNHRLDLKYDVEAVVAEGGFAVVYRARHCSLRSRVAIKVLKVPDGLDEPTRNEWMRQFAREAQTLARLEHPAIVGVLDFGVSTLPSGVRAPWMALEWIDGHTLADELESAPRPYTPAEALARLRPVISALASAHAAGVAHRDVKPSNVMCVDAPGEGAALRLVDFGIAKATDPLDAAKGPSGETATRSAMQAYSLPYAAPEQISNTRTGPWTDVHALGLVLTEVLTGKAPYPGGDAMALCADVLAARRPTPARAGLDVGAWEPVLARAVALRPGERYADAGALLAALEASVPAGARAMSRRSWWRRGAVALAAGAVATSALAVARERWTPRQAPRDVSPRELYVRASPIVSDAGVPGRASVAAAVARVDATSGVALARGGAPTSAREHVVAASRARRAAPVALQGPAARRPTEEPEDAGVVAVAARALPTPDVPARVTLAPAE